MTTEKTLAGLVAECIEAWRAQDAEVSASQLTQEDCDWICEQMGRKPTREEWADAGLPHVGSAHVGEGYVVQFRGRYGWEDLAERVVWGTRDEAEAAIESVRAGEPGDYRAKEV